MQEFIETNAENWCKYSGNILKESIDGGGLVKWKGIR